MPDQSELAEQLRRRIVADGPIPLETYMAEANAAYYAKGEPLGAAGDFITAPEVSQMFGEIVGLWFADLWARAERPQGSHYVELGPGRGTMAADALRAMATARFEPSIQLVETSPALRQRQAERLPGARWHGTIHTLPRDGPLLVAANEFFDALPIRQLVATGGNWCERLVGSSDDSFIPVVGPAVRDGPALAGASEGTIVEASPAAVELVGALARRIAAQGGAALIIDYGRERSGPGETLQAVRAHGFADPWQEPGECDLTAHVDLESLAKAARAEGLSAFGPIAQGDWLQALGIELRAAALAKAQPGRSAEIEAALVRLVAPEQMGSLFKVMAMTSPGWPRPAAF